MGIKQFKSLINLYLACPKCNTNGKPEITRGIRGVLLTWSYCCKNCGFNYNYTGVFNFLSFFDSFIYSFLVLAPILLFLTQGLELAVELNQQNFIVFLITGIIVSFILGFILSNLYLKCKMQIYLNRSRKL